MTNSKNAPTTPGGPVAEGRPRVVVGIDCSATSSFVLKSAAEFATVLGADLHAVFVYLPAHAYAGPWPIAVPRAEMQVHMDGVLGDIVRATFGTAPPDGFVASAVEGDPAKVLLALARNAQALVVGASGHSGLAKLVLGSVSATCVEHSAVPVYVVHAPTAEQPAPTGASADSAGRIVVGVDGSLSSRRALAWAGRLARERGLGIDAVITWRPPVYSGVMSMPAIPPDWDPKSECLACLTDSVDKVFGADRPSDLRLIAEEGDPALHLTRRAEHAALLVLGNRGLGGFAGLLLGSVSGKCANHAKCPVLVVHGGAADKEPAPPAKQSVSASTS